MKITGGKLNSISIKTPQYENIKPTLSKIREAVFNTVFSEFGELEGLNFADLFAGSGIMSFEAFSRGFNVTTIELDKKTFFNIKKIAQTIIKSSNFENKINIINSDSKKFLQKNIEKFDVIYIDPPYNSDLYREVLGIIAENELYKNTFIITERPSVKEIDYSAFKIIKTKTYGDKVIDYVKIK